MWMLRKLGWLAIAAAFARWGFELFLAFWTRYPFIGGGELHLVNGTLVGSTAPASSYIVIVAVESTIGVSAPRGSN